MPMLLNVPITGAVSNQLSGVLQARGGLTNLTAQGVFTYGSSGTSTKAWVQTSFDGGSTWMDIILFSFTTSALKNIFNLSSLTPVTTAVVPGDGAMTTPVFIDGMLGSQFRVKYTTTGTYAGNTNLRIDLMARGLTL